MTSRSSWVVLLSLSLLAGCNMITGADAITLADDDDETSAPDGGFGGAATTAGPGGGTTAPSGVGGSGNAPPQPDMAPADGVSLSRIVAYQGVEREMMAGGQASGSSTPIVAGRDALVRVFYDAPSQVTVTARLVIDGQILEQTATLAGTSSAGQPDSTINFHVPAAMMTLGASYRVELLQPIAETSGTNTAATYPASGAASLETKKAGTLVVKLVPVQYNGDSSGRMPDTSAAQLKKYEDLFYAMYPVEDVQISVRGAVGWNGSISANGNGWGDLLNAIADLRQQDNAPFDTYYYGIFEPASTFSNYCSGGCVLGLGFVGSAMDDYGRAAIGIGYGGDASVDTAVHELGHNHGREHAPCGGASGTDGSYPYSGAKIGSWGYNLLTYQLFPPNDFVDMMSYCDPAWISDYNFTAIFNRVSQVSGADVYVPAAKQNLTYQRARVDGGGQLTWMSPITMKRPPVGTTTSATIETAAGPESTTATFIAYDHLPGGVLFVPPTSAPLLESTKALRAVIGGQLHQTP